MIEAAGLSRPRDLKGGEYGQQIESHVAFNLGQTKDRNASAPRLQLLLQLLLCPTATLSSCYEGSHDTTCTCVHDCVQTMYKRCTSRTKFSTSWCPLHCVPDRTGAARRKPRLVLSYTKFSTIVGPKRVLMYLSRYSRTQNYYYMIPISGCA
eukprot:SAG31_NODE_6332_length_2062_cov_1.602649_2_plen_152_part_00